LKIEAIIQQAVTEGIKAGLKIQEKGKFDAYKATERRLYAIPDIKDKITELQGRLQDLRDHGRPGHSKDICRFQVSGQRLTDDEILDALIQDIAAAIAKNEYEIKEIDTALAPLKTEQYYPALEGRYFNNESDDKMAVLLHCDTSTVRRNRAKLVRRVAIRLYGVDALDRK